MIANFWKFYCVILLYSTFTFQVSFAIKSPDYEEETNPVDSKDGIYDDSESDEDENLNLAIPSQTTVNLPYNESPSSKKSSQEVTSSKNPKTDLRKPKKDGKKPKTDSYKPKIDLHEPKIDSQEPKIDLQEPKKDSQEPKIDSQEPKIDSQEPKKDLQEPKIDSQEPKKDSQEPKEDLHEPKKDSQKPPKDSQNPTKDSKKPTKKSQKPTKELQKSTKDSQKPTIELQEPAMRIDSDTSDESIPREKLKKTDLNLKKVGEKVKSNANKECFSCNRKIKKDQVEADELTNACYKNDRIGTKKCARNDNCYIEVNPNHVKRGCIGDFPDLTFVCDRDHCNDKPTNDSNYYSYAQLSGMKYDNAIINQNETYYKLFCKKCEGKKSKSQDMSCFEGTEAASGLCRYTQLCYTQIRDKGKHVKRGCISKPAYNSYFYFCNSTKCNNESFERPIIANDVLFRKTAQIKEEKLESLEVRIDNITQSETTTTEPDDNIIMLSGSCRIRGIAFVTFFLYWNLLKNIKSLLIS